MKIIGLLPFGKHVRARTRLLPAIVSSKHPESRQLVIGGLHSCGWSCQFMCGGFMRTCMYVQR